MIGMVVWFVAERHPCAPPSLQFHLSAITTTTDVSSVRPYAALGDARRTSVSSLRSGRSHAVLQLPATAHASATLHDSALQNISAMSAYSTDSYSADTAAPSMKSLLNTSLRTPLSPLPIVDETEPFSGHQSHSFHQLSQHSHNGVHSQAQQQQQQKHVRRSLTAVASGSENASVL